MTRRGLRALDLFCGAGGATAGLQAAGYHVTGVDLVRSPNYRGDAFWQTDARTVELRGFDLIWASPPCQAFTRYRRNPGRVGHYPNLIPLMRRRLRASGARFVIENVEGAPLRRDLLLCGSMFGLEVRRHRVFELNFDAPQLRCRHEVWTGRFPHASNRVNPRRTVEVGAWRVPLVVQARAMGIEWMTREELSEAVPPAYAEFIALAARGLVVDPPR